MEVPLKGSLNPSFEDIYEDLYMDYFIERVKKSFPSYLSKMNEFQVIIKLMAWAVARSYQQPRILKYLYNPSLVMEELLPRLADTLSFTYPVDYSTEQLRILIKYLQKIRRSRGTIKSIKQLVRLLETSEEDIYSMSFMDYNSVEVISSIPGVLIIQYGAITDQEFAESMLKLVVPAGYRFYVEAMDSKGLLPRLTRRRMDVFKVGGSISIEIHSPNMIITSDGQWSAVGEEEEISIIQYEGV